MVFWIALALAHLVVVFVAYPLRRPKPLDSLVEAAEDAQLGELYSKRDATYSAFEELKFDLESGSLSEEDYRDLETKYQSKAISILREIDDLKKGTKGTEGTKADDEIERQVLELRQARALVCPQCGARRQQGDRFCPQCGTSLSGKEHS